MSNVFETMLFRIKHMEKIIIVGTAYQPKSYPIAEEHFYTNKRLEEKRST